MQQPTFFLAPLFTAALTLTAIAPPLIAEQAAQHAFRIYIKEPGAYQVTFEALLGVGLEGPVASNQLRLSCQGDPVPLWLEDGQDGTFGPGDWIEFVGEHLAGEKSYYHDHSQLNVYWLHLDGKKPLRMKAETPRGRVVRDALPRRHLSTMQHREEDQLMIRLNQRSIKLSGNDELWYWAKLTQIDAEPFKVHLDMSGIDREAAAPVRLALHFRPLSRSGQRRDNPLPDHQVDVLLNDEAVGAASWDGDTVFRYELELPAARFEDGENVLALKVPVRVLREGEDPLIDVVMFNWLQLGFPHRGLLADEPVRLQLAEGPARGVVEIVSSAASIIAYGDAGSRIIPHAQAANEPGAPYRHRFRAPKEDHSFLIIADGTLRAPQLIERDRLSNLATTEHQADYLMIVHPRLREATEPLAAFHRSRGLTVEMIDVQDIYDEFNHGILHPESIRAFISHAYHHWARPAPRFVLLVGDASWDSKNVTVDDANYANWTNQQLLQSERFPARPNIVYKEKAALNHRNLIPTWSFTSSQGHSASDNHFVAVEEDDFHPALAIGRFPVIEPEEVRGIVDKTIRYANQAAIGPWRRNILWITNEARGFQRSSDFFAEEAAFDGFTSSKVYPSSEESSNEKHQQTLLHAFNEGQVLVHFYGHGGRFIWRTGPPDFKKNHDLFTLDHINELEPNDRLPVVLSMTCYSAPFDHPNADSIGEKFLRVPDRGAVAIFAASWRNSPSRLYTQALLEELTTPGQAIGTAIMHAKQQMKPQILVEMYNLLGDPAIPLAVPALGIEVTTPGERDASTVTATIDHAGFQGRAIVDWLDDHGDPLYSHELRLATNHFEVSLGDDAEVDPGAIGGVRVYAWNEDTRQDGLGALRFEKPKTEQARQGRQPAFKNNEAEQRDNNTAESRENAEGQENAESGNAESAESTLSQETENQGLDDRD